MNPNSIVTSTKVPSTLVRPQYSQGLLLNDDDLTQAVDYTRELNRLLFRSLLGYGVISGLLVKPSMPCGKLELSVEPGVALDCHGDALHLPKECKIAVTTTCTAVPLKTLWVVARRHQKYCAPRGVVCTPDDDDAASAFTRIHDGVEIAVIKEWPACVCGCKPPEQEQTPPPKDEPKDGSNDPVTAAADNTTGKSAKTKAAKGENGTAVAATQAPTPTPAAVEDKCTAKASSPCDPCYKDHYAGIYDPVCAGCGNTSEWLMLARLDNLDDGSWKADHVVRRFIRPLLMVDPQFAIDHPPQKP